jgi:two-component system, response regulator PdtaR
MNKYKILIVDDEILVAKSLEIMLKGAGYIVSGIVVSGQEAILKAKKLKPDLVLMDITLKGEIDGIQTAEYIQKNFKLPIIFLTAHNDKKTVERAKLTQPFGYITKPFDETKLLISIEMSIYKAQRDNEREQLLSEKEKLIKERELALNEVKILRGIIPICSHCNNIRNDEGYWEKVADYIRKHSQAEFSHSICPECMKKYYSEFNEEK